MVSSLALGLGGGFGTDDRTMLDPDRGSSGLGLPSAVLYGIILPFFYYSRSDGAKVKVVLTIIPEEVLVC